MHVFLFCVVFLVDYGHISNYAQKANGKRRRRRKQEEGGKKEKKQNISDSQLSCGSHNKLVDRKTTTDAQTSRRTTKKKKKKEMKSTNSVIIKLTSFLGDFVHACANVRLCVHFLFCLLSMRMCRDVGNSIRNGVNFLSLIIRDLNYKFILESHDNLNCIETI
jgi:hypothetical protein